MLAPTVHSPPLFAWNATSKRPFVNPATLGLVPLIIPSPQARLLAPTVHSPPLFAWNATSKRPFVNPATLGLVPAIIPRPHARQ